MSKLDIKKVYSDNPYADELVYFTLQLGIGTVLKLQSIAEKYETMEILRKAGVYISCIEGNAILGLFDELPYEVLTSTLDADGRPYGAGLPHTLAMDIVRDSKKARGLSQELQDRILTAMQIWYIEHYVEENTYYRMLNGQPPIGYKDIYVEDWRLPKNITIDNSVPVHKMKKGEITILDNTGVLDDLYDADPENRGFLKHMGNKQISIYKARKTEQFGTLYMPSIKTESIREMFTEKLENNKTYTMRAVYSEAYKFESEYYDNIMAIFILLISMIDVISRVQEFITKKEIFDIRSCEYLFQSYGVEFFPEIPLRYQIAMVKNIHTLLKYKSTAKCMIDICSLFGFDNVKVFKYYLLKDHKIINSATGDYSLTGDPEKDYTLKFIKLPLTDNIDDYIRVGSNHIDYDELTDGDPTWDGGLDHIKVKQDILREEFNIVRTKYISIDTIYDIAKMAAQQCYFFNMLYDNHEVEELLTMNIPYIDLSATFRISDVFSFLTALSYYYYGTKDILMDTQDKVLHVNGFNFKADLGALAASLQRTGHTLHAMEQLKKFQIPEGQIPSFDQMMDMFVNNLDIREELINGMAEADNLRVFLVYKKLYDSLMVVELTMDHFKNPETGDFWRDEEGDPTYAEYFKHKEPILYYVLMECASIEEVEERKQYISNLIDNVVLTIENYIDLDEFQALLRSLPAVSAEAIKQFIAMCINFYKSYKVDFLGLNTIYYLDDKLDGLIRIIDDLILERYFEKNEDIWVRELIKSLHVDMTKEERIKLLDVVSMNIRTWIYKNYHDHVFIRDDIPSKIVKLAMYSVAMLQDTLGAHISKHVNWDSVAPADIIGRLSINMTKEDKAQLRDIMEFHYWYTRKHQDTIHLREDAISRMTIREQLRSDINISEIFTKYLTHFDKMDFATAIDFMRVMIVNLTKKDSISFEEKFYINRYTE